MMLSNFFDFFLTGSVERHWFHLEVHRISAQAGQTAACLPHGKNSTHRHSGWRGPAESELFKTVWSTAGPVNVAAVTEVVMRKEAATAGGRQRAPNTSEMFRMSKSYRKEAARWITPPPEKYWESHKKPR